MRLDQYLCQKGLVATRSAAAKLIRLGQVRLSGQIVFKPGAIVRSGDRVNLIEQELFVSRGAYKLRAAAEKLAVDFKGKTILDVGSSTGGFSDLALRRGAKKVIAVDVGTDQMDRQLRLDPRIELYEKTDIRGFSLNEPVDIILADVSFISLRQILPSVRAMMNPDTLALVLCKPQFEAGAPQKNRGVVKHDTLRRAILRSFEQWLAGRFIIKGKADCEITGAKGNRERFYLLARPRF